MKQINEKQPQQKSSIPESSFISKLNPKNIQNKINESKSDHKMVQSVRLSAVWMI